MIKHIYNFKLYVIILINAASKLSSKRLHQDSGAWLCFILLYAASKLSSKYDIRIQGLHYLNLLLGTETSRTGLAMLPCF